MLEIRVGRNGESFYGMVVSQSEDTAFTFFCTKENQVVHPKEHSIADAGSNYQRRVLDDQTRGYQEVLALDLHPNSSFAASQWPLSVWADMIASHLISVGNPGDAGQQTEIWLRGFGQIIYHHPDASLEACIEALANIRGPDWAF